MLLMISCCRPSDPVAKQGVWTPKVLYGGLQGDSTLGPEEVDLSSP